VVSIFEDTPHAQRVALLELDIDLRTQNLWRELHAAGFDDDKVEAIAAYMRAAYALGYVHALEEPEPGQMCRDNGYKTPARRSHQTSRTVT
jgi:hypothetical protein